jgi:hypothetical protein
MFHTVLGRVGALVLAAAALPAQAAELSCSFPGIGLRVLTVDPAATCTAAGTGNLGDPATLTALNGATGALAGSSSVIDRDIANSNGGALSISGIGTATGSWSFSAASSWDLYNRVFMYFHFGGGGSSAATDPDWFIVELSRPNVTGTWELDAPSGPRSLSNIALVGMGTRTSTVPLPGTLALAGAGLLAAVALRRR